MLVWRGRIGDGANKLTDTVTCDGEFEVLILFIAVILVWWCDCGLICLYLYKKLCRPHVLEGFGCVIEEFLF